MDPQADIERVIRETQEQIGRVEEAQTALAETSVSGHALDGRVEAVYRGDKGLVALNLDPRVMRMSSADLADGIVEAVQEAAAALQKELYQQMDEILGANSPVKYLTGQADARDAIVEMSSRFNRDVESAMAEVEQVRRSMGS